MSAALAFAALALLAFAAAPVFAMPAPAAPDANDDSTGDAGPWLSQDLQPGTFDDAGAALTLSQALPGVAPSQLPAPDTSTAQANERAFLQAIRAAEGTAKAGGYGALFGWPMAGRTFDPFGVSDHPRVFFDYTDKAGKKLKTSAAGAYQITWTTWQGERSRFAAWCARNGYQARGFSPAVQDAFALYLLDIDGALGHVRAGRLDQALSIARRRWASLPGAGYNQPERSRAFVLAAYQNAGGTIA